MHRKITVLTLLILAASASHANDTMPSTDLAPRTWDLGGSFSPQVPVRTKWLSDTQTGTSSLISRDDGSFENGYSFFTQLGTEPLGEFVHRLDLPGAGGDIDGAVVCMMSATGGTFAFDFVVYEASGSDPGAALGERALEIDLPVGGVPRCETYSVQPAIAVDGDRVFAGVRIRLDQEILVAVDENGSNGGPGHVREFPAGDWEELGEEGPFPSFEDFRNLGVRVNWQGEANGGEDSGDTSPCSEGAFTMCLNSGRFEVEVDFETPTENGIGHAERLTDDTGYFWFFDENNVEVVVKVLNACGFANRFWVFAGGLTNVEVELSLRDTRTGTTRSYQNPINTEFQPIQDTGAFATCP